MPFLTSRGIDLPEGGADDPPVVETARPTRCTDVVVRDLAELL